MLQMAPSPCRKVAKLCAVSKQYLHGKYARVRQQQLLIRFLREHLPFIQVATLLDDSCLFTDQSRINDALETSTLHASLSIYVLTVRMLAASVDPQIQIIMLKAAAPKSNGVPGTVLKLNDMLSPQI